MSDTTIIKKKKSYDVPEEKRLFMDLSKCTACRSCELMCSYHHTGGFSPSKSSIIIDRNDKKGTISYYFTETCDLCKELEIPACVSACSAHALCIK